MSVTRRPTFASSSQNFGKVYMAGCGRISETWPCCKYRGVAILPTLMVYKIVRPDGGADSSPGRSWPVILIKWEHSRHHIQHQRHTTHTQPKDPNTSPKTTEIPLFSKMKKIADARYPENKKNPQRPFSGRVVLSSLRVRRPSFPSSIRGKEPFSAGQCFPLFCQS